MTDPTPTQRIVLTAAAARPGRQILPLPDHLKGGAAKKVIEALRTRGFVAETPLPNSGQRVLVATSAGLAAVGHTGAADSEHTPDGADTSDTEAAHSEASEGPAKAAETDPLITPAPPRRKGTKQAQLIAMLERPEGATIAEIAVTTGWQHHTVRGAFAGVLKKRFGLVIASDKVAGRGRVYRLPTN